MLIDLPESSKAIGLCPMGICNVCTIYIYVLQKQNKTNKT